MIDYTNIVIVYLIYGLIVAASLAKGDWEEAEKEYRKTGVRERPFWTLLDAVMLIIAGLLWPVVILGLLNWPDKEEEE